MRRRVANLELAISPIFRMDPGAREGRMAAGSDQIMEPEGVVKITQPMLLSPAPPMLLAPMRDNYFGPANRCPTFTSPHNAVNSFY